jgi:hypothetical protein
MGTFGAGRHSDAAVVLEQGQRYSDQCSALAAATAAEAVAEEAAEAAAVLVTDQPAVTSAKASCAQSADADSMVRPREVSSAAEPEWKENGVRACGRVTKPSPVTGRALAPPLGDLVFSWCGRLNLDSLPNEVLMHILGYLEVYDLLATSRVCWFSVIALASLVTWWIHLLHRRMCILMDAIGGPSGSLLPQASPLRYVFVMTGFLCIEYSLSSPFC